MQAHTGNSNIAVTSFQIVPKLIFQLDKNGPTNPGPVQSLTLGPELLFLEALRCPLFRNPLSPVFKSTWQELAKFTPSVSPTVTPSPRQSVRSCRFVNVDFPRAGDRVKTRQVYDMAPPKLAIFTGDSISATRTTQKFTHRHTHTHTDTYQWYAGLPARVHERVGVQRLRG